MKINLKGLSLEELKEFFAKLGEPPYRASQLFTWIYQKGIEDFSFITNMSKSLRLKLAENAYLSNLKIVEVVKIENTQKYLFALEDGNLIESVLMHFYEGHKPERLSICVSTQVGCAYKCNFCASGKSGLSRNLTPAEIVDQILKVQKDCGQRIDNVVFMGIGEPLANYDHLIKAIKIINHPDALALGARHITISTCGLVPEIRKLADESLKVKLAISLHAPDDVIRVKLLPLAKKYPLPQLMEACRYYQQKTKQRLTFEYILIRNFNDRLEDAQKLGKLLKGIPSLINLIPLNEVEEFPYQRSTAEQVSLFQRTLAEVDIKAIVRQERGSGIKAACGQLRARRL
jgi:23S rRNA (adenine2503-C2)-methyltransferase